MNAGSETLLSGCGKTSPSRSRVVQVRDPGQAAASMASSPRRGVLARGLGRSYGDMAQNAGGVVLDMTPFTGVECLDEQTGTLTALAGTSLGSILAGIVTVATRRRRQALASVSPDEK